MVARLVDDADAVIYHGDALAVLAGLEARSVQCIVTSPPFWGLRDYGTGEWSGGDPACEHDVGRSNHAHAGNVHEPGPDGNAFRNSSRYLGQGAPTPNVCRCGAERIDAQIGLEETPEAWCAALVAVFREARRVLRDDGVLWVEIGDTYASNVGGGTDGSKTKGGVAGHVPNAWGGGSQSPVIRPDNVKPKDLVGAPWLLAFALRADGWYLRADCIWHRPNPMPESVTDRPTKAHSYVFLLSKRARYYYDADAIREPAANDPSAGGRQRAASRGQVAPAEYSTDDTDAGRRERLNGAQLPTMANARTVWTIATEPTPFAHFATFPQALAERCIKAGTSEHGCCSICGAPWRRLVDVSYEATQATMRDRVGVDTTSIRTARADFVPARRIPTTTGWEASCEHLGAPVEPCTVLDPFMGSGTVALVARRLGRHAVGVELSAAYGAIAARRLQQLSLFGEVPA